MAKYAIKINNLPKSGYNSYGDYVPDVIPYVSDHNPVDTGLVDKDGNAIMRLPNPIGFIWDE